MSGHWWNHETVESYFSNFTDFYKHEVPAEHEAARPELTVVFKLMIDQQYEVYYQYYLWLSEWTEALLSISAPAAAQVLI